jgi:hypothetical protein
LRIACKCKILGLRHAKNRREVDIRSLTRAGKREKGQPSSSRPDLGAEAATQMGASDTPTVERYEVAAFEA